MANGFLEFDIANRMAKVWDAGKKRFTMTNEKELGHSVPSALQHPRQTQNPFLHVASVEATQQEILAALEQASGSTWTVTETTTAQETDAAGKKLARGDFSGALTLVRATVFGNTPGLHSNYARDETLANDVLGLPLESVRETVERVLGNLQ